MDCPSPELSTPRAELLGCKLTPRQIRPFIPSKGITLMELSSCFSSEMLPHNHTAVSEFLHTVKSIASERSGTSGKYFRKQHGGQAMTSNFKVVSGGTLASMPKSEGQNLYSKTVKIKSNDAFPLSSITMSMGPYEGCRALIITPFTDFFRFLDLPPELRQMIYDLLLQERDPIPITTFKPVRKARRPCRRSFRMTHTFLHLGLRWDTVNGKWLGLSPSPATTLLLLNKQVHAEVVSTLYSGNNFSFEDFKCMELFLETIDGVNRKYLRHITLSFPGKYATKQARPALKLLKDAKTLRSITMAHNLTCRRGEGNGVPKQLVTDAELLLKTLYIAQTQSSEPLQVLDLFQVVSGITSLGTVDNRDKCDGCRHGRECGSFKTGIYCTSCNQLVTHLAELNSDFRKLVTEQLGVDG